ncbi:MAG: hypothetical protein ACRDJ4_16110 [Actinomycetota bacterium]
MSVEQPRAPEDLSDEERGRLRLGHHRLRKASQDLEGITAPTPLRGRWQPATAPPEAVEAAIAELEAAYEALRRLYETMVGRGEAEP